MASAELSPGRDWLLVGSQFLTLSQKRSAARYAGLRLQSRERRSEISRLAQAGKRKLRTKK